MARNKKSRSKTFRKPTKWTKAGYRINRNGVPIDLYGKNPLQYIKTL